MACEGVNVSLGRHACETDVYRKHLEEKVSMGLPVTKVILNKVYRGNIEIITYMEAALKAVDLFATSNQQHVPALVPVAANADANPLMPQRANSTLTTAVAAAARGQPSAPEVASGGSGNVLPATTAATQASGGLTVEDELELDLADAAATKATLKASDIKGVSCCNHLLLAPAACHDALLALSTVAWCCSQHPWIFCCKFPQSFGMFASLARLHESVVSPTLHSDKIAWFIVISSHGDGLVSLRRPTCSACLHTRLARQKPLLRVRRTRR